MKTKGDNFNCFSPYQRTSLKNNGNKITVRIMVT